LLTVWFLNLKLFYFNFYSKDLWKFHESI
jgi:hypothetical protein